MPRRGYRVASWLNSGTARIGAQLVFVWQFSQGMAREPCGLLLGGRCAAAEWVNASTRTENTGQKRSWNAFKMAAPNALICSDTCAVQRDLCSIAAGKRQTTAFSLIFNENPFPTMRLICKGRLVKAPRIMNHRTIRFFALRHRSPFFHSLLFLRPYAG